MRMLRLSLLFCLTLTINNTIFGQHTVAKWAIKDVSFAAKSDKPFGEKFGAVFTSPKNQQMTIPGFYNGNGEWIIRFSASDMGKWSYTTYSTVTALSGKTGTIEVTENKDPNEHGGIVIKKDNPQHFSYEDNTPYFLTAFELDWLFAMDYGKDDLTKAKKLLHTIKEKGFNQVVMNVYAYDIVWKKDPKIKPEYEYGSPSFFPFGGNNTTPDFSKLNTDYFKHFDKTMQLLKDEGIAAHLMIYVWNKRVNWPAMYSEADNMYFDYVIARYQAYTNIVWDISKEALYYGRADANYVSERIERVRRLDAYKRLLSVHDFSYCSNYSDKVDFISIQYWGGDLPSKMKSIREKFKTQPIFNIEHGGYEEGPYEVFTGNFINAEECLKRNYACAFSGVYSTHYWQNTSWNVIIPDPYDKSVSPQPKLHYYQYFTDLFTKYPFQNFKPNQAGEGSMNLTDGKGTYLVFFPASNYALAPHVKEKINAATEFTWFDPYTGVYTKGSDDIRKSFPKVIAPEQGKDKILIITFKG